MIKPQPEFAQLYGYKGEVLYDGENRRWCWKRHVSDIWQEPTEALGNLCPYGRPGDKLVVKEAAWMWCAKEKNGRTRTERQKWRYEPVRSVAPVYVADQPAKPVPGERWRAKDSPRVWRYKSARFMPRWASRLTIEITGIRAERLQAITLWDICKEGLADSIYEFKPVQDGLRQWEELWDGINAGRDGGRFAWAANPWVWVLEFKRV